MKTKIQKIASSPTKEGIINLINKYYYSTTFDVNFESGEVKNSKGILSGVKVENIKNRYVFFYVS